MIAARQLEPFFPNRLLFFSETVSFVFKRTVDDCVTFLPISLRNSFIWDILAWFA